MVQVAIKWAHKIPGKEIAEVWGTLYFESGERVYSYDIGLKTILDFVAMPEYPGESGVFLTKYLMNHGQPDNYASLWAWTDASTEVTGSVWANFHALGA